MNVINEDILIVEEDQICAKKRKREDSAESENQKTDPKKCASSRCSLCSSYEHTVHICLERTTSN